MYIQAKLLIKQYTNFGIVSFYYFIHHLSNHDVEITQYCTMQRLQLRNTLCKYLGCLLGMLGGVCLFAVLFLYVVGFCIRWCLMGCIPLVIYFFCLHVCVLFYTWVHFSFISICKIKWIFFFKVFYTLLLLFLVK